MKLKELLEKARQAEEATADYVASSKDLHFVGHGGFTFETKNALFNIPETVPVVLTDWSKNQVAGRLDAPGAWLWEENRCPNDLQATIMNRLVEERNETDLLIRTRNATARAVLSDSYTIFDNTDLIDLVTRAIDTMNIEPDVVRSYVDDNLSAYVIFPQVSLGQDPRDPGHGGQLHPAIHISNSEIGGGAAKIVAATFTGFCQNGVIYGWKSEETLAVRHRYLSKGVMGALVAQAIASGLEMSETAAKKFIETEEVHIEKPDLQPIVERWAKNYGLSVNVQENWLRAVIGETSRNDRISDPRLFDIVNGATLIAQEYSAGESVTIERMAGDIIQRGRA